MIPRRISAGLLATGCLASTVAAAAAARPASTPSLAPVLATGAPGALVLVRNGTRTTTGQAGVAIAGTTRRIGVDQPFRVGSITKTFVAVVVLQLAEEHRLGLDDTVEEWLPGLLPYGAKVTLRHLLQHTSGIPDHLSGTSSDALLAPLLRDPTHAFEPGELVESIAASPPLFAAGTGWAYSNANYVLLGLIAERVTGKPLAKVLDTQIIRPLGLRHTSFPNGAAMPPGAVHGYLVAGNPVVPTRGGRPFDATFVNPSYTWAAGALVSTASDLDRFLRALVRGKLVSQGSLTTMTRAHAFTPRYSYGLGLLRVKTPCGPLVGHDGELFGYSAIALTSLDGRRSAVVLANTSHVSATDPEATLAAVAEVATTALCDRSGR
ncbi:MAG: serine hydrolase domain-containing protein [Gaiellales bacterium]